jgi:hypothetical protein
MKVVFSNYSNIKVEEEYSPVSVGAYCRIDAVALFPDGTGVGELTFLVSSRGNVFFFNLLVVLILERSCDTICLISIGMPCLEMKSRWWYGSQNARIDKK